MSLSRHKYNTPKIRTVRFLPTSSVNKHILSVHSKIFLVDFILTKQKPTKLLPTIRGNNKKIIFA